MDEVRLFVAGSAAVDFAGLDRESTYEFTRRTLARFGYGRLGKADKGLLRRYLTKATGLSRAQVARLIGQHAATGRIVDRRGGAPSKPFARVYTAADARRLAEADELLGQLSGPATRAVMRREFEVFGDARFERLAHISNGHLYNLRKSRTYQRRRTVWTRTKPSAVAIGERRKPQPDGQPGFARVDSVHQGDLDGRKGVYEINLVDVRPLAVGGHPVRVRGRRAGHPQRPRPRRHLRPLAPRHRQRPVLHRRPTPPGNRVLGRAHRLRAFLVRPPRTGIPLIAQQQRASALHLPTRHSPIAFPSLRHLLQLFPLLRQQLQHMPLVHPRPP